MTKLGYSKVVHWLCAAALAAIFIAGCTSRGGHGCARAVAGCLCYPNNSCEPGYTCGGDGLCSGGDADASAGGGNTAGSGNGNAGTSSGGNGGSSNSFGCNVGWRDCGTGCVNPNDNPLHCGGCDQACGPGDVCQDGQCMHIADCTATPCVGFTYCDLTTKQCNPGCGSEANCAENQDCSQVTHACSCKTGFHDCSGSCVASDSINSCGTSCSPCPVPIGGTASCDGTSCSEACPLGTFRCGDSCWSGDGTGPDVCGPNCEPCPTIEHSTASCSGQQCQYMCDSGYSMACGRCVADAGGEQCSSNADCCAETGQICMAGFCNVPYRPCSPGCPPGTQCSLGYCAPPCVAREDCPAYFPGAADIFMVCNESLCGMSCGNGVHHCPSADWSCNTVTAYRCEWN